VKKPSTKLTDPAEIKSRFDALFLKANGESKAKATDAEVKELRAFMREHDGEKLWQRVASPGQAAIDYLLQQRTAGAGLSEAWREQIGDWQKDFGFKEAPRVEKFLIQHIILCWLQLNLIELMYAEILSGTRNMALDVGRHWDRRLSLAQKRFTRATEALERLRALTAAARYAKARAEEAEQRRQPPTSPPALTNEERAVRVAEILGRGGQGQTGPRALTA
jgi:hypothetical protein